MIEIHKGIMFDFCPGLPQLVVGTMRASPLFVAPFTMVMLMIRLATDELVLSVCEFENTAHCYMGSKCVSLYVVNKLSSQPVDYPPHWLIFTMYGIKERPLV